MIIVLGGIFSYWLVYWLFAESFPYDPDSKNIKPTTYVKKVVFRNMLISIVSGPVIWYLTPDLSEYFTDNYILRFLMCIIIADGWFYFIHRMLHSNKYYKWHKQHHQFHKTYPLVALYASPIEAIFCDFMSAGLGPAMIRMHTFEFQVWMIFMSLHSLLIHSSLDYGGDHVDHHGRIHHNYGLFSFFDRIMGTYNINK
jgi:sterol desaturase/sphingolipid hydroxylase (fatty acid hydroxylase superfamily)